MQRSLVSLLALGSLAACTPQEAPVLPEDIAGRCTYVNRFSDGAECRDYLGPWALEDAARDCEDQGGAFEADARCDTESAVGWCALNASSDTPVRVAFAGGSCSENERGCEIFGGGIFLEEGTCGTGGDDGGDVLSRPFPEPEQSCVEGPEGSEDTPVCQWITMQGCTEPGLTWEEYGSCELPRQQRGYYPVDQAPDAERADPRMDDAVYAADLAWVKEELSSCACFCCHSSKSPDGPSNWYVEQPGNFVNGMFDTGIAQGAGVIDSVVLGDIDAEDNNGFTRLPSIFPSTDPLRMQAFFQRELDHRGLTAADFEPIGYYGPLTDQDEYVLEACEAGEGVAADGTVTWVGGSARLVHVLEADAENPGVPPNRDTPAGTLWRVDARDPTQALLSSGLSYGAVPAQGVERVPAAALTSGETYAIYVSADYLQPVTRCLFVMP